MKCCNNPKFRLNVVFEKDRNKTPDRYYQMECLSCGSLYKDKIILFNDSYRLFSLGERTRKLICKIFGHKKHTPSLHYNYNTLMGLKVYAEPKNVNVVCTRCGKSFGDLFLYDRNRKLNVLLKKSKKKKW